MLPDLQRQELASGFGSYTSCHHSIIFPAADCPFRGSRLLHQWIRSCGPLAEVIQRLVFRLFFFVLRQVLLSALCFSSVPCAPPGFGSIPICFGLESCRRFLISTS
jgi:hypothetical protein